MDAAAGGLVFVALWGGLMLLVFGGIGLAIWALVDLLDKPEWAWQYAGENRTTYIVLLVASFFVCQFLAWIPALMYFKGAKPKIQSVLQTIPPPVLPGPYGGYGYGPAPGQWVPYQPYPAQPHPGQGPGGTWSAPPPQAGYPSPGQGVPRPQPEPSGDEWWKQPGATPPEG